MKMGKTNKKKEFDPVEFIIDQQNELLNAEGCVIEIVGALIDMCERITKRPDLAPEMAKRALKLWKPMQKSVIKTHKRHKKEFEKWQNTK